MALCSFSATSHGSDAADGGGCVTVREHLGRITFNKPPQYVESRGRGETCYGFPLGTVVEATAEPRIGYRFKCWAGEPRCWDRRLSVTVTAEMELSPVFEPDRANSDYVWIQVFDVALLERYAISLTPPPLDTYVESDRDGNPSSTWYRYPRDAAATVGLTCVPKSTVPWSLQKWQYTVGLPPGPEVEVTEPTLVLSLDQEAHVMPVVGYRLTVHVVGDGAIHFGESQQVFTVNPVAVEFPAGAVANITPIPGDGSSFEHCFGATVKDGGIAPITMASDQEVAVVFAPRFQQGDVNLNVTVFGNGAIQVNDFTVTESRRFTFAEDVEVTLRAIPDTRHKFAGWGGHAEGMELATSLFMSSSKSVSASFLPEDVQPERMNSVYTITEGNGEVTPTATSKPWEDLYPVEFTALPYFGWRFVRWEVNGSDAGDINRLRIRPLEEDFLTAVFEPGYSVVLLPDRERGRVSFHYTSPALAGMLSPWSLGYRLDGSDQETLRARPESCNSFSHWEGSIEGTDPEPSFRVQRHMLIKPVFRGGVSFNVSVDGPGTIAATLDNEVVPTNGKIIVWIGHQGNEVILTATAAPGYRLDRWEGDVTPVSEKVAYFLLSHATHVRCVFTRVEGQAEIEVGE